MGPRGSHQRSAIRAKRATSASSIDEPRLFVFTIRSFFRPPASLVAKSGGVAELQAAHPFCIRAFRNERQAPPLVSAFQRLPRMSDF
jgi:hypothetical protein